MEGESKPQGTGMALPQLRGNVPTRIILPCPAGD